MVIREDDFNLDKNNIRTATNIVTNEAINLYRKKDSINNYYRFYQEYHCSICNTFTFEWIYYDNKTELDQFLLDNLPLYPPTWGATKANYILCTQCYQEYRKHKIFNDESVGG